jgi:hypothetical protein
MIVDHKEFLATKPWFMELPGVVDALAATPESGYVTLVVEPAFKGYWSAWFVGEGAPELPIGCTVVDRAFDE